MSGKQYAISPPKINASRVTTTNHQKPTDFDLLPVLMLEDGPQKTLSQKMLYDLKCSALTFIPNKAAAMGVNPSGSKFGVTTLPKFSTMNPDSHFVSNKDLDLNDFKRSKVNQNFVLDFLDGHFHKDSHNDAQKPRPPSRPHTP
jgi:hypothetical protein